MKATVTRKTYYLMGLAAACCTMAGAFFALSGDPIAPLESIAFALTGLMFLFLAAVKGSPAKEKQKYFLCFLVTLAANVLFPGLPTLNYILMALPWPLFGWLELNRGNPVLGQLRLLAFGEALAAVARVAVALNVAGLGRSGWLYYAMEILACAARGWLALTLYRLEDRRQQEKGER